MHHACVQVSSFQISCWLGNIKTKTSGCFFFFLFLVKGCFFFFLWKKQHALFVMNKDLPAELAENVQVSNMPRVTALNIKSQNSKPRSKGRFFFGKRSRVTYAFGLGLRIKIISLFSLFFILFMSLIIHFGIIHELHCTI